MTTFLQTLETFFWNVLNRPGLSDIADILIVAIIIYELLMLTRDTRGSAVLKGLAMLLLIVGISNLFGLTALNWLLMSVVNNGALVLTSSFSRNCARRWSRLAAARALRRSGATPIKMKRRALSTKSSAACRI